MVSSANLKLFSLSLLMLMLASISLWLNISSIAAVNLSLFTILIFQLKGSARIYLGLSLCFIEDVDVFLFYAWVFQHLKDSLMLLFIKGFLVVYKNRLDWFSILVGFLEYLDKLLWVIDDERLVLVVDG